MKFGDGYRYGRAIAITEVLQCQSPQSQASLGGCGTRLTDSCMTTQSPPAGDLTILRRALDTIPDLHISQNKVSLTLSFGDDGDRLYVGWDGKRQSYRIWYQADANAQADSSRENHAELVFSLFQQLPVTDGKPDAVQLNSVGKKATIWCGNTIAAVTTNCQELVGLLTEITLNNALLIGGPVQPECRLQNPDEYFLDVAKLIRFTVDGNLKLPRQNWRQTLGFDLVDDFITIGYTQAAGQPYREHVIPVVMLKNHAFGLAEAGASIEEIAHFLKCHLFIVKITTDEAELLNNSPNGVPGQTLKDSMPKGWCWGDNPLDRLLKAGIHPSLTRQLPKWEPEKYERSQPRRSLRKTLRDLLSRNVI